MSEQPRKATGAEKTAAAVKVVGATVSMTLWLLILIPVMLIGLCVLYAIVKTAF